ncbi:MAG: hypothetical protein JW862_06245 [Anaerolineales bacterium]|nr:hypothetical protein [Anaerolineales bacterium]
MLSTLLYRYFQYLLRQPRLSNGQVLFGLEQFDTRARRALFIATENLHAGIAERQLSNRQTKKILHAGYRNFRESWGRDFGFASYGLLALQAYQPVKETLQAFFWHQTSGGQLPVKLHSLPVFSRFLHALFEREQSLQAYLRPKYQTGHRTESLDGQALLVSAACNYIAHSGDSSFARQFWEPLQQAMRWLQSFTGRQDHLLHQRAYADWADSVARHGAVLYTNVVYWQALQDMAALAQRLDYPGEADLYSQEAKTLQQDLNRLLWLPEVGFFATNAEYANLSSAGNLLAVAWGLATESQGHAILDALAVAGMATPVPTRAAYPAYRRQDIAVENRLGGLANYHTEGAWLWIGAWHLVALCRLGRLAETQVLLDRIAAVVTRDQQVHEVYGPDGQPLSSFWYTSEAPLTWNAGMLVYAFDVLGQQDQA